MNAKAENNQNCFSLEIAFSTLQRETVNFNLISCHSYNERINRETMQYSQFLYPCDGVRSGFL